jgi:hypothetical protein
MLSQAAATKNENSACQEEEMEKHLLFLLGKKKI